MTPAHPDAWLTAELTRKTKEARNYFLLILILRAAVIFGFLAIWQLAVAAAWIDPFFTSSPIAIASFLSKSISQSEFWHDIGVTASETILGVLAASILGMLTAFVLSQSKLARDVTSPILSFMNSLPRVALAPLLIAIFGLGLMSKIVLAFSLCFFIILEGALTGLLAIDADINALSRQLGAKRVRYFASIVVPSALPSIFAALRLSLIYGLLAVVVGEMIGSNAGVGQKIAFYSGVLRVDAVFGLLLVLGVIAALLVEVVRMIERRVLKY